MILGKTVTAPSFPPSYLLFSLIILNLVLYFFTFNGNLYKILIYIYGMMMLYDAKECETYLKYTIPINIVLVFARPRSSPNPSSPPAASMRAKAHASGAIGWRGSWA